MAAKRYTNNRTIRLQVSGIEEMLQRVQAAGKSIDDAVKMALHESAMPIYNDIKAWAEKHKRTGVTLAGVELSEPKQSGNYIAVTVGINDDKSPGAWHSVFVEYGSPRQPADPGVRPAFERNKSKVKKIQRDVLRREGMPVD